MLAMLNIGFGYTLHRCASPSPFVCWWKSKHRYKGADVRQALALCKCSKLERGWSTKRTSNNDEPRTIYQSTEVRKIGWASAMLRAYGYFRRLTAWTCKEVIKLNVMYTRVSWVYFQWLCSQMYWALFLFPKNKFRLQAAFIDVTITNYMPAVVLNRRP